MNIDFLNYRMKLQHVDWSNIICLYCGAPIYLTGILSATWFHKYNCLKECANGLTATPDVDKAVRDAILPCREGRNEHARAER